MHAMIPLSSKLENRELEYVEVRRLLGEYDFSIGGSWDYDHGSFDRTLDEEQKVWLRVPFSVTNGNIDAEADENDAKIRIGQPFVLKHLYNDGQDETAQARVVGALIDQFQSPTDPDAHIEPHWVDKANAALREAEAAFP
jgi:hypothetical protein